VRMCLLARVWGIFDTREWWWGCRDGMRDNGDRELAVPASAPSWRGSAPVTEAAGVVDDPDVPWPTDLRETCSRWVGWCSFAYVANNASWETSRFRPPCLGRAPEGVDALGWAVMAQCGTRDEIPGRLHLSSSNGSTFVARQCLGTAQRRGYTGVAGEGDP